MNYQDLIFWYTGMTIWAILGFVFAVSVVMSEVYAIRQIYLKRKQWWMAKIVCENKDRDLILTAFRFAGNGAFKNGEDLCKWLDKAHKEYELAKSKAVKEGGK